MKELSKFDIRVLSLLEVTLYLGIENLSIGRSNEYIFKIHFSLLIFWNMLFVFGTVRGDDMGTNLF